LPTEGTGQICRAALLQEHNSNKKKAHDDVNDNDEVEEDLHCFSCFPMRSIGAEGGT
jgi:hypothetical protein